MPNAVGTFHEIIIYRQHNMIFYFMTSFIYHPVSSSVSFLIYKIPAICSIPKLHADVVQCCIYITEFCHLSRTVTSFGIITENFPSALQYTNDWFNNSACFWMYFIKLRLARAVFRVSEWCQTPWLPESVNYLNCIFIGYRKRITAKYRYSITTVFIHRQYGT